MADLPVIEDEVIARLCDNTGIVVYEATEGTSFTWGMEINSLIGGNPQMEAALRDVLLNDFGIVSLYQTEDGGVFAVPHNQSKECVEFRPAGAG